MKIETQRCGPRIDQCTVKSDSVAEIGAEKLLDEKLERTLDDMAAVI